MKMRKALAIMLALALAFSMSALAFADDDPEDGAEATESEEAVEDNDEGTDDATDDGAAATAISGFVIPVPERVVVSTQALMVDGDLVDVQPYNIDGANYFKLRDLAALITGTGSQFDVDYEAPNMIVTTGEEYTPIDGDLSKGEDMSASCVPSTQTLLVDGEKVDILVYNIGGNNFFQLRGLGELVGYEVDYDDETRTMIVETAGAGDGDDGDEGDEGEGGEEESDEESDEE